MKHIVIFLILIFVGCSPQKRLNRILDKYPQLQQIDTISLVKSVIERDTFVFDSIKLLAYADAIQVLNEGLLVENEDIRAQLDYLRADTSKAILVTPRLLPSLEGKDRFRLQVDVKPRTLIQTDTVYIECETEVKEVKCDPIKWYERGAMWWGYLTIPMALVGLVLFVLKRS